MSFCLCFRSGKTSIRRCQSRAPSSTMARSLGFLVCSPCRPPRGSGGAVFRWRRTGGSCSCSSLRLHPPSCLSSTPTPNAAYISPLSRSEEHTSELQSPDHLVCRLLLVKIELSTCMLSLCVSFYLLFLS